MELPESPVGDKAEETKLVHHSDYILSEIQAVIIKDRGSYEDAGIFIAAIAKHLRSIKTYFSPMVKAAHEAHKIIKAKENEAINPCKEADSILRNKMSTYLAKVEAERAAEQDRLDKEQAEIEAAAQKIRDMAEEENRPEIKEKLEETAEAITTDPVQAVLEVEKTTRTETATISHKTELEIGTYDEWKVLKAVLDNILPLATIHIDIAYLKKLGKVKGWTKDTKIPGLIITEKLVPIIRGK